MGEISNKTLAMLVLAALVVVVLATTAQLSTVNQLTGQATTGTGDVQLTIGQSLAIEVDGAHDTINFGTCSPNATGTYTAASNDAFANTNCTADTVADQKIQINNVGNVDADVNFTGECTIATWLPETDAGGTNDLEVMFEEYTNSCGGTLQTAWASLAPATANACDNLTVGDSINMSARVTIDTDTLSTGDCGGDQQNTVTFEAFNVN